MDEINRATPRTQSSLLEAMQERQVSAEGETRALPDPFLVLATQNPIELEGTFSLPEAQLDRFLVRIHLGYPEADDERRIARRYRDASEPLDAVGAVAGAAELGALRAGRAHDPRVRGGGAVSRGPGARHARRIPTCGWAPARDRPWRSIAPSQGWALLAGRDFTLPDDVRAVAHAVLDHRVLLDVDRELRGATVPRSWRRCWRRCRSRSRRRPRRAPDAREHLDRALGNASPFSAR